MLWAASQHGCMIFAPTPSHGRRGIERGERTHWAHRESVILAGMFRFLAGVLLCVLLSPGNACTAQRVQTELQTGTAHPWLSIATKDVLAGRAPHLKGTGLEAVEADLQLIRRSGAQINGIQSPGGELLQELAVG